MLRGGVHLYSVDIDTGGTMTDTLITGGGAPVLIKVESTPHDVTVSFMQSLEAAAKALSCESLAAFLDQVKLIRWSSTITSNVLAQRAGPKLGLVVSIGHEHDLYATNPADTAAVVPSLVRPEHIAGLPEHADRGEIVAILKRLIDQGIRRINVSLKGAFPDGRREQEVLKIVAEQFPDHYLGSVPALAGSDMLMRPDDMSRTFFALINSYVHNSLANSLFKAEDAVKVEHNWKGDILVGHLSGGVARIGKTKAVDTIESGPLFGTHASAHVAKALKLPRVLAIDIGGTTGKVSAVTDGRIEMKSEGAFFGIPVRMPMAVLRSNALGGGSVARAANGTVTLGPDSMGAAPGPACYGLGGTQATLTDALVTLGLISPTGFLNGRRVLNTHLAAAALKKQVADPLSITAHAAAEQVYARAVTMMSQLARDTLQEAGWATVSDAVLFAYGGNGPLFATAIAEHLGLRSVRCFALGTVFSAYGSAIADVVHLYERALVSTDVTREINTCASELFAQAARDLKGEGFDPARASLVWTLEGPDGARVEHEGAFDSAMIAKIRALQLLSLAARFPIAKQAIPERTSSKGESKTASRQSPLSPAGELPVHDHDGLFGRTLRGPLIVDGGTFTWYVGARWELVVDLRGDGLLTQIAE